MTFEFGLHMFGSSMGSLNLERLEGGSQWKSLWSKSGNQGSNWKSVSVQLPRATTKLRFRAVTGSSWSSDIAVDNLKLV